MRLLATVVVAAALVAVFYAAMPRDVELRLIHTETEGAQKQALDVIVSRFQADHPTIKVRQVGYDDDAYTDGALARELQSDAPPDVYFQWAGLPMQEDAAAGTALDLTDALAAGGWQESFVPAVWTPQAGTLLQDRRYLVPDSIDLSTILWFNRALFRQAGVEVPRDWAGLIAAVRKLRAAGIVPIVIGNEQLWPLGNWAAEIAARLVPRETYDAAFRLEQPFAQPAFEQAFAKLAELANAGAFNGGMGALGADPAMTAFFASAAAIHPIGSWLVSAAMEYAPSGFDYDCFATPPLDATDAVGARVSGTITGYMVSRRSRHPKEAIEFLRFLTSPPSQTTLANAGIISPLAALAGHPALSAPMVRLEELVMDAHSMLAPPDTAYPVPVADAFYRAAAYVAEGTKAPREALVWLDAELAKAPP